MQTVLMAMLALTVVACAPSLKTERVVSDEPMKQNTHFSNVDALDLQGHRGARGLAPENTLAAFERALALKVTTLEMDVVITKDLQVVVSHESWFSGVICSLPSGEPVSHDKEKEYKIFEMTYDQVRRFDCGLRGNPRFPRQTKEAAYKPLLKEVIDFAENYERAPDLPPILYNIETKSDLASDNVFHPSPEVFTRLLYEVLDEKGVLDRTTIQSFDPRTLRIARDMNPDVSLALLVGSHDVMDFAGHVENLGFIPQIYSPNYRLVDRTLVERAHQMRVQVIPWTVNTLEEMQSLVKLGVDGIITDYPDIGRQLISEEG